MAELDPQQVPPEDANVIVEETPIVIPANRPRKVYAGMWGPFEIASVAIAFMAMLSAFLLYFFFVIPSDRELARNRTDADRLDAELISARSKYGEITDTETQVAKLISSVDDFETQFLPMQTNGQAALYQRVNALIRAYGLENTTGPDYTPLETVDRRKDGEAEATEEEKGRAKFRSLYPGLYITTTVEGSYQNLRRFIREIETGREFVVISAVELAPSDTEAKKETDTAGVSAGQVVNPGAVAQSGKPFAQPPAGFAQPQQPAADKGKTRGETVSLHLEMAAYFRRPNFVPMTTAPAEQ